MAEFRERRRATTVTSLDVDDALEGAREHDGTGLARPDLDQDDGNDEHADEASFGREAAWPQSMPQGRVPQIGCVLAPDPSRPAAVVSPADQLAWQALGGAAAEQTGR